ncbi:MAG: dihydropteroate synthase [Ignavibacteria bacterium]|jgi:dihydropteroate synthase|nr:dihydropteroate synthase [Ignavibacteria bacterium]MDH7528131.1 dihydropteroate synthase [Ignavibacteria bacterium]
MEVRIRYFNNYNSFKRIFGESKLAENFLYPTFALTFIKKENQKLFDKVHYFFKNTLFEKVSIILNDKLILLGDLNFIKTFADELKIVEEPVANYVLKLLSNYQNTERFEYRIGERVFNSKNKYVMGILNVTEDSFFDGGKYFSLSHIKERIDQLCDLQVDIIDIGGESTRPGSEPIDVNEELKRVLPAVEYALSKGMIVSVDTYKSLVAEECLKAGVQIINDISGFKFDEHLPDVCAKYNSSVVLMHIRGTPKTMQENPFYYDTTAEIFDELSQSIKKAEASGIKKIFIDPGIGFGKRLYDNYEILNRLEEFKFLGYPILVGLSRKSFIGKYLNQKPEERLTGTIASNSVSLIKAANIIRVHDVKEAIETKKIIEAIISPEVTLQ